MEYFKTCRKHYFDLEKRNERAVREKHESRNQDWFIIPTFSVHQDSEAGTELIVFQPKTTQGRNLSTATLQEEKNSADTENHEFEYGHLSILTAIWYSRTIMFPTNVKTSILPRFITPPKNKKTLRGDFEARNQVRSYREKRVGISKKFRTKSSSLAWKSNERNKINHF